MPLEYKNIKAELMGIEDRTVTGLFAVHGNVDSGDGWSSRDRSHPGLFGDFLAKGRARAQFLWQHDGSAPPIATIDRLFEVDAADLPPAVKLYAPDATGGVAVTRTYLETARANEVLAGLKAGAIREMSYAYEATRWDYEKTEDDAGADAGVIPIRNLYAAQLFDVSDVSWGMKPATSADAWKTGQPLNEQHDAVLAAVRAYHSRLKALSELRAKEGRVLSGESRKRVEAALEALNSAGVALKDLLSATEPPQQATADLTATRRLRPEYERTRAYLNGVSIP